MQKKGLLIVLSGPSGVGKDTVLKNVMSKDGGIRRSVSVTTRAPRPGEVDGVSYYFIDQSRYDEMADRGDFLEHETVHGNSYATPASYVEDLRVKGMDVVLVIDVKGGLCVKQRLPEAVLIFILPKDMNVLSGRLTGRNTDSSESIAKRMGNAPGEIETALKYDYVVVNDDLEECSGEVLTIINALRAGGEQAEKARRFSVENNKQKIYELISGGNLI